MRGWLAAILMTGALLLPGGAALAHHSFSMFDQQNKIEIEGVVREYKFVSPHSFIVLLVKSADGSTAVWTLEGQPPAALVRDGWARDTLSTGDEIKAKIAPLRSGAPGGWWTTQDTAYRDGKPIKASPQVGTR